MRYAYVKNGNAVDQVRRLAHADDLDRSGPDAFVGTFIQAQRGNDLLLLCRTSRRERYVEGGLRAEAFPNGDGRLFGVFARGWSAMRIGIQILRWRPQRVLCGCAGELLWICVLVSKLLGVPLVHSRHNMVQRRTGVGGILTALDRMSIRACAGVVCHGPFLRDQILALGVPATSVVKLSHSAQNTREEAVEAARLIQARRWKRVVVVTSNYHARRARFIYGRVLPSSVTLRVSGARDSEFDPSSWWETRQGQKLFMTEFVGYLVARWELRTTPAPEKEGGFVISPALLLAESIQINSRAQTLGVRRPELPLIQNPSKAGAPGAVQAVFALMEKFVASGAGRLRSSQD